MNRKRVVILRSNPVSPDPRVEKTAQALAEDGWQVTVVGWDRSASLPTEQERGAFRLVLCSLAARFGSGMGNLRPLLRWQWFLLRWLLRHRGEYAVIHACDFDTVLPAFWMKVWFGKRLVYDIFDFYADHLRSTPRLVLETVRRLDLAIIDRVDAVIVVDEARKGQIALARPRRLEVIYNTPVDAGPAQPEFTAGTFRLAYVGLLTRERGLLETLRVLARHPDWHLDLAGFGGDAELILAAAQGLANVTWHGQVDYRRALHISGQADVLFATYDPAIPNHRLSSPNKVFEAMMLGKALIVSAGTHMDEMVEQAGCGLVVPYGDESALEGRLQRLATDPDLRRRLGVNGRQAYQNQYSWNIMKTRLSQLYRQFAGKQPD